jgi:Uma2 family endonuclease
MSAPAATRWITARQFAAMSSDVPSELVRGEVVEMPRPGMKHGVVCGNAYDPIKSWARSGNRGLVAINDTGILTERDPDTVRGPDVLFISRERWPHDQAPEGFLEVAPDLAVEVLSHFDVWKDVLQKISEYFDAGVREVWVADPELKNVQVFRPDAPPRTVRSADALESADVLPGFSCHVADLFIGA